MPALLGRPLTDADDKPGAAPITVISYAFWQRQFGGAPDVVGRSLSINRMAFTIVGVTPPGFFGPVVGRTFDVAVPLNTFGLIMPEAWLDTGFGFRTMMVRLKSGQTLSDATAGLSPMTLVPAATEQSYFRGQYARPLYTLMAVVGLVLLVACATIANLLLARATARRLEMSVRMAIGGSRWRLLRQLLTECLVVAVCGAIGEVLIAALGSRFLVTQLSAESVLTTGRIAFGSARLFLDVSTDWHVLAFTAMVALGTALLFGIAPALRASGIAPVDVLKESGPMSDRGATAASGFVIAQLALSLVLVVAAGLLIRTFTSLANLHLGLRTRACVDRGYRCRTSGHRRGRPARVVQARARGGSRDAGRQHGGDLECHTGDARRSVCTGIDNRRAAPPPRRLGAAGDQRRRDGCVAGPFPNVWHTARDWA